jgi:signal transduction histidine kinase
MGESSRRVSLRIRFLLVLLFLSVLLSGYWVVADSAATVGGFRTSLVMGAMLALILSLGLAAFLTIGVAAPLDRLSREALRIHRGPVGDPIRMERPDEVGRLARALEMMRLGTIEREERSRLMMAQVADEIRGPLESLQRVVALAGETESEEEREALLLRIRGEVGSLHRVVGDFMELARPLSPRQELHDIRPALESAVELLRGEEGGDRLQLEVSVPGEPLLARIDPSHVRGITLNLLRNAAEAGDRVCLTAEVARGEVILAVRDDGPGVPESTRDRVFDAFVTDKPGRAGLGLAIVRRLAEGSGGRVELTPTRDTVGEGAEFRVYLQGADDLPPTPSALP